jgi:hypothetical protein
VPGSDLPNYTIVRSAVTSLGMAKLLYYIGIAYKGEPRELPSGTPQRILPILEVKLSRSKIQGV